MKGYDDLPRWAKHTIDQILHTAAGFTISALVGIVNPTLGLGVSILTAIVREAVQNWGDEDNNYEDMVLDVTFWSVGAVLGATLASLVF